MRAGFVRAVCSPAVILRRLARAWPGVLTSLVLVREQVKDRRAGTPAIQPLYSHPSQLMISPATTATGRSLATTRSSTPVSTLRYSPLVTGLRLPPAWKEASE